MWLQILLSSLVVFFSGIIQVLKLSLGSVRSTTQGTLSVEEKLITDPFLLIPESPGLLD